MSRFGSARQAAWRWLRSVAPQRRYLGRDLRAGLPGAIGSVPDGMAAAILAGVNPGRGAVANVALPVTVFSTVGFGDITAKTETARLVVTG